MVQPVYQTEAQMRKYMRLAFEVNGEDPISCARKSRALFIRGNNQMNRFEHPWRGTGEILSAERALRIYGMEIIAEAIEFGAAVTRGTEYERAEDKVRMRSRCGRVDGCCP